ncbi:MAG: ATP-binding protein [Candidatus Sumerlaeaceae bacterium]|nr:ATP-binding protein [Candidatus Sumerlaeaceae bacterium]
MSAYLYPNADLGLSQTHFELRPSTTTVGRHPNNDLSLLLESVSRFHARLECRPDGYYLTDLGSSNGTFVNGERLSQPRRLADGDTVTFGRADFVFSTSPPEVFLSRKESSSTGKVGSGSVALVGDESSSSVILATQLNVEGAGLTTSKLNFLKGHDLDTLLKANERLVTLYKLSEALHASTTREEIMAKAMELLFDVMPADRGVILTMDGPDSWPEPAHVRFRDPDSGNELTISRTIIQKCIEDRVAILSRDAKIDSRFSSSESILAHDIRSAMCVPLLSGKKMLGVLFVDTKESVRVFTDDDLAFASSFANDIAMSLDNMALFQENVNKERLAAVGQTIAGLAHNIKNILQLARGGIELMDSAIQREAAEEIASYWPVVRRGIERMQKLTQEMLDYSRQTRPELVEANVNSVINDTVATFMQDAMDKNVEFEVNLSDDVPMRMIDPDGLNKAIMNLVSNSIDAFEGFGGKITLSTAVVNGAIHIKVEDNGKGIPKDKIAKIFQPFFSTKGSKGTGLGLPMTKKYIEDMGGELKLESEEGRGTTFTIVLPLQASTAGVASTDTSPAAG